MDGGGGGVTMFLCRFNRNLYCISVKKTAAINASCAVAKKGDKVINVNISQ